MLLLHVAGEQVHDIYDTLAAEAYKYADTKQKLTVKFSHKRNVQYQVSLFIKAMQEPGKNLDSYHSRFRILAKHCDFANVDAEIKTQIIQSCKLSGLRGKALR